MLKKGTTKKLSKHVKVLRYSICLIEKFLICFLLQHWTYLTIQTLEKLIYLTFFIVFWIKSSDNTKTSRIETYSPTLLIYLANVERRPLTLFLCYISFLKLINYCMKTTVRNSLKCKLLSQRKICWPSSFIFWRS